VLNRAINSNFVLLAIHMDILIKNGNIITSEYSVVNDVYIHEGKIHSIGKNLKHSATTRIVDASGKFVFPGGVDPHVHMCLPTPAGPSSDDFRTGSIAALYGGTTTLIDFVTPVKGESLPNALEKRKREAENSLIDYSFHVSPIEWHSGTRNEISDCFSNGITSFKVYLAYRKTVGLCDADFLKVLRTVGELGGIVTAHCELGEEIERLRDYYFSVNKTEPLYHYLSRPAEMESDSVKKAIALAQEAGCSFYVVHVSTKKSLFHIEEAKKKGQQVYAETCPHYLLLNNPPITGSFASAAPYIISPPLREPCDNEALWHAINKNVVSTIGTDHCPFNMEQKRAGANDFRSIPNGAGSIEYRLPLLYTYGVLGKKISINKMVDIFSTMPAKIFGLFPQKGCIAIGSDADIVIWNPDGSHSISLLNQHQHCDINIYNGLSVSGHAEYIVKGGEIAVNNDILFSSISRGRFLKRNRPEL